VSEEPAQEGQFTEADKEEVLLWLAALQALFDDALEEEE